MLNSEDSSSRLKFDSGEACDDDGEDWKKLWAAFLTLIGVHLAVPSFTSEVFFFGVFKEHDGSEIVLSDSEKFIKEAVILFYNNFLI